MKMKKFWGYANSHSVDLRRSMKLYSDLYLEWTGDQKAAAAFHSKISSKSL
jgi:hypothetical protein